jgi:hypothetical protein
MFLKQKLSVALLAFIAAGSTMASAQEIEMKNDEKPAVVFESKRVPLFTTAIVKRTAVRMNRVAATTTTTTTLPPIPQGLDCPDYYNLAKEVGWPEDQLDRLDFVLWRESRCDPSVHNTKDPAGGSRGLIQINGYWCRKNTYNPDGFLQARGVLNTCEDLFDPETNLKAGLAIYNYGLEEHGCGWGPWKTKRTNWCR